MKYLLVLMAFFSLISHATPLGIARDIESEILLDSQEINSSQEIRVQRLRQRLDDAMNGALDVAYGELYKAGRQDIADGIRMEWEGFYGASLWSTQRGIGAHKPLSQWIADQYNTIEGVLGKDVCIATHIADIKSINFGVPVTIHPCSFQMDGISGDRITEYRRHFCGHSTQVGDEPYYGVVPVVTYWAIYIGCSVGTSGTGFVVICGGAGMIGERIIANYVAPGLSDKVYTRACGG